MSIPGWILTIKSDTLRAGFLDVWKNLPDFVRPALMLDRPGVYVVDEQDTVVKSRVGVNHKTGQTALMMFFRRDLLEDPPAVLRCSVVHELAHVYLRHFDHVLSESRRDLSSEVLEYFEWHADFCARHLFGFDDDYQARNEYLAIHPELDEAKNAA